MVGILRMISVPSIGVLFQAYPATIPASVKKPKILLSPTVIVTALLRNRWNFSTSTTLCLRYATHSYFIWKASQANRKKPLNGVPSSITTRYQRPNFNKTSCIKYLTIIKAVIPGTGTTTTNSVRSQIQLKR